jgi:hypothetical protein
MGTGRREVFGSEVFRNRAGFRRQEAIRRNAVGHVVVTRVMEADARDLAPS